MRLLPACLPGQRQSIQVGWIYLYHTNPVEFV